MKRIEIPQELLAIIRVGIRAHREVPGSVALGGSIVALYCNHRTSVDIDFVLTDLTERFQEIREHLFEVPDWKEARAQRPVLILGSLGGVEVGYRQLRRSIALETEEVSMSEGLLTIPTLRELISVKAFLLYDRNYTRDFFDFAELACLLETREVAKTLFTLDQKFAWEKQPSIALEVMKNLLNPAPHDLVDSEHGFDQLRLLKPKLKSWEEVSAKCREVGKELSLMILERPEMKHRNLRTEHWSKMAIDSLFERGNLPDWKEFASVLSKDKHLAAETLAVCRYHKNSGSVKLARILIEDIYPNFVDNE